MCSQILAQKPQNNTVSRILSMVIYYTTCHISNSFAWGFNCNMANCNSSTIVWYIVGEYCGDLIGLAITTACSVQSDNIMLCYLGLSSVSCNIQIISISCYFICILFAKEWPIQTSPTQKNAKTKSSTLKTSKPHSLQICREFLVSTFYNQETQFCCYDSTDYSQVFNDLYSFNVKLVSLGGLKMMKWNSWLNN